jgi:hypothetical protein
MGLWMHIGQVIRRYDFTPPHSRCWVDLGQVRRLFFDFSLLIYIHRNDSDFTFNFCEASFGLLKQIAFSS